MIAVNVDKSLTACLLLEYDFYFVFCVYLGQKVGCILTLCKCVCVCVCVSKCVSPKHTNIHPSACVYVYYMRAHKYIYPHTYVCIHRGIHTYLAHTHTRTSNLQSSEALCAYVYVCPYAHFCVCVCAYTGISRSIYKHSLSSQQRLYAAVILPYKSGIPSFLRHAVWRPSCSFLGVSPELQNWHLSLRLSEWQMASSVASILAASYGISLSMSATPFCLLLLTGLGVVVGFFFGVNCK